MFRALFPLECIRFDFLNTCSSFFSLTQRPLKTIAIRSGDVYIPRGVSVPALDKDILWDFEPKKIGKWMWSIEMSIDRISFLNTAHGAFCLLNTLFLIIIFFSTCFSCRRYSDGWRFVCCMFYVIKLLRSLVHKIELIILKLSPFIYHQEIH